MTTSASIAHQLRRQSIVPVESTTPPEMTIEQWRSRRRVPCHHLHDTTTRYDCVAEVLSFLLVCTVCGTARVVETGATSRASSPAPTTGAAPRSATAHEAGRAGPVDAGGGRRRDARLLRPVQRRVAVARAR